MNRFQRLAKKRQLDTELEKEVRDHLERQASDYRRAGLTEEEARRKARLIFGGIEQVREECRQARGMNFLDDLQRNPRYAVRALKRSPGFRLSR
ncbi:MAG: permease prefix domain 1-containing protein [Bryobacteraceae bacterium]